MQAFYLFRIGFANLQKNSLEKIFCTTKYFFENDKKGANEYSPLRCLIVHFGQTELVAHQTQNGGKRRGSIASCRRT